MRTKLNRKLNEIKCKKIKLLKMLKARQILIKKIKIKTDRNRN
jgi:hypothetical protein